MATQQCPICGLKIHGRDCEEAKRLLKEHFIEAHSYNAHKAEMAAAYTPCFE